MSEIVQWHDAAEAPPVAGGVYYWVYFPDVDDGERGYGYVGVSCHDGLSWVDWQGRPNDPQPTSYATIYKPCPPR